MWPFKRKQSDQSTIPVEVKEYYQAERRERVGVAWLLAFATLITTLLLAVGIFFGGRWAYRYFTDGDKPKPVAVTPAPPKSSPSPGQALQPAQPNVTQSPQPSGNQNSIVNQPQTNSDVETPDVENPEAPSSVVKTPSTQTPTKQSTPTAPLAKTGPAETTGVFVAVSVIATLGHYLVTKRRLSRSR